LDLETFPDFILGMRNLEYLDISSNESLSVLPDDFYKLEKLRYLDIKRTRNRAISPLIGKLRELRVLKASNNLFTSLPEELFGLEKLVRLDVDQNFIKEFVCPPGGLPGLRWLDISPTLGKMKKMRLPDGLTHLDISLDSMHSLLSQVTELRGLRNLIMTYNKLSEIPDSIGNLTRLRRLDASYNEAYRLSPELLSLKDLRFVRISQRDGYEFIFIPEIHGKGTVGLRRLLADYERAFAPSPAGKDESNPLNPRHYFHLWNRVTHFPSRIESLMYLYRARLLEAAPHMEAFLGAEPTWEQVSKGVRIILEEGLSHFIEAILYPYRIVDGMLYRLPGRWDPFEMAVDMLHAATLALIGQMDEEKLNDYFGEGRVRSIFDKIRGAYGLKGSFPHLEELSVECESGKLPEELWSLPSLKRIDVYGADQSEVQRLAEMRSLERLRVFRSHFRENFSISGHPALREVTLEIECGGIQLHLLNMDALESLRLKIVGDVREIEEGTGPKISSKDVQSYPKPDLHIAGCPSLKELDLIGVRDLDLERICLDCPLLESVSLKGVIVPVIPEAVGSLARLQSLDLYKCAVEVIPECMTLLTNLRCLRVYNDDEWGSFTKNRKELKEVRQVPAGLYRMPGLSLSLSISDESRRRMLAVPGAMG
jgi:Leucine-rich repeat (LRR) protein